MTKYNKLVDHLVSTMKTNSPEQFHNLSNANSSYNDGWTKQYYQEQSMKQERKSFDELYEEYSSKSIEEQLTNLKQLGRELVTRIDRIVDNLDVILEGESNESERLHKGTKEGLD
tara:strand:- start:870 stop:1214 length:345 start_codon:yes stop_codon:yes gene_type:complete